MDKLSLALLALAVAVVISPAAKAATITESGSLPLTSTDILTSIDVQQFDSSLGTLNSIVITLDGSGLTDITGTNSSSNSPGTVTKLYTDSGLTLTLGSISLYEDLVGGEPYTLPSHLLVTPVTIVDGTPYDTGSLTLTASPVNSGTISSGLGAFIGGGNVVFDLSTFTELTTASTGGNLDLNQTSQDAATVDVLYNYTPNSNPPATPEPSSLMLLGTGLLGLAVVLFRKMKPASSLVLKP